MFGQKAGAEASRIGGRRIGGHRRGGGSRIEAKKFFDIFAEDIAL
jgi:hypothetical protein